MFEKKYLYETHLHTKQGSACGKSTGREMAIAHKEAGYAGIIVTDHFFYGNTAVDRSLPWEEWVHQYCAGYRDAKAAGDEIGLDVFFGWESGYDGTEFLIYGLDEEWLVNHPEIRDASVEEQYKLVHEAGGVVIHAHPFRERAYISEVRLYPEYVDGVEIFNASNEWIEGEDKWNISAKEYAEKYDFPVTAGSDIHWSEPLMTGVAFDRRLNSIEDFVNMIMTRQGEMVCKSKYSE